MLFKLKTSFPSESNVARLSNVAFRLYVTTLCWCKKNNTDCHIERDVLKAMTMAPRGAALVRIIHELEDAGVFERDKRGWKLQDYSYSTSNKYKNISQRL
jgi:hypothetical protein